MQAFLIPLQIFNQVSAKLNPAMCLAQWVTGSLNGVDFICLSLAEVAGAFVGEQEGRCGSCKGSCWLQVQRLSALQVRVCGTGDAAWAGLAVRRQQKGTHWMRAASSDSMPARVFVHCPAASTLLA